MVYLGELMSPTSTIITAEVVGVFQQLAGDFYQTLPFALLTARNYFHHQSYLNPSDSDENECRKLACEVLARKIVAKTKMEEQYCLLSARYTLILNGEETLPTSALESAVDQHATFFLSSNESQRCVFALWRGLLVQTSKDDGSIEYLPYDQAKYATGFLDHFNPSRLGVPRYQFFFRIWLWAIFIFVYSIAIQTPERVFGIEDIVLYVQVVGYVLEDLSKIYKIGAYHAVGFWTAVNLCIYVLLTFAFGYRFAAITTDDDHKAEIYRLLSFQFMSSASPLIWMKLLTIFDLFQYFGTLQIVVWRMLKESAVFFTLLGILAVGFGQALTGLDAADGHQNSTEEIVHSLIQGLLGSPAFDLYSRENNPSYPFNMILYYTWSIMTLVLLLNILVALFGTAYQECTDEAVPTFLAFFAGKTIAAIRAPDTYVYVAPFNLIEVAIMPLEFCFTKRSYAKLNRAVMSVLFCVPLCLIAVFETHFDHSRARDFASLTEEVEPFSSAEQDPTAWTEEDEFGQGDDEDLIIARKSFEELRKGLPSLDRSTLGEILYEISKLREQVAELKQEKKE